MPDNVKVTITERNGTELQFREELDLTPSNIPFSDPSYSSDNVKDAILETSVTGGQSRYCLPCGYESTVQDGRWLEFHRGNPSNTTPYIATEDIELISLSFSIPSTKVSVTVAIYNNGTFIASVVLANDDHATLIFPTPFSILEGAKISVQKTAGDNPSSISCFPHFKVII